MTESNPVLDSIKLIHVLGFNALQAKLLRSDSLLKALPWDQIARPLARAEDALARLDEQLAKSPIRDGWIARTHFTEACASLWLDGALIHLEDLVFHDAGMDIRTPTHELTQGHGVLRMRRRLAATSADWILSNAGLERLCFGSELEAGSMARPLGDREEGTWAEEADENSAAQSRQESMIDKAIKDLEGVLKRSQAHLDGNRMDHLIKRDPLTHDSDWDECAKLKAWRNAQTNFQNHPPVLAAALSWLQWEAHDPLQHRSWLGRFLAANVLRQSKKTKSHFACFNIGLRAIPRERRRSQDQTVRLIATLEAFTAAADAGLKDHDRWLTVREQLLRKCEGRRSNSKLPLLVDYMIGRPLASAAMIAHELGVTSRAAQDLVNELGVREATGRARYRAWGIS